MEATRFDLGEAVAVLARTPAVLRAQLEGLPRTWLEADEGAGTFNARDVLAHLCSGEVHDWLPRARVILAGDPERVFDAFDRFAFREQFADLELGALLDEFDRLRAGNLALLERLGPRGAGLVPADLERSARHPEFGRVTLAQLLSTWVVHDLGHSAQIGRVLAKRYAADVGPWSAYLPILTR